MRWLLARGRGTSEKGLIKFCIARPLIAGGAVVIAAGTTATARVVEKKVGQFGPPALVARVEGNVIAVDGTPVPLPGLTGLELVAWARRLPACRGVPNVTGYAAHVAVTGFRLGHGLCEHTPRQELTFKFRVLGKGHQTSRRSQRCPSRSNSLTPSAALLQGARCKPASDGGSLSLTSR